jgi:hypothetical protein
MEKGRRVAPARQCDDNPGPWRNQLGLGGQMGPKAGRKIMADKGGPEKRADRAHSFDATPL